MFTYKYLVSTDSLSYVTPPQLIILQIILDIFRTKHKNRLIRLILLNLFIIDLMYYVFPILFAHPAAKSLKYAAPLTSKLWHPP